MTPMHLKRRLPVSIAAAFVFSLACASGLPAVVSSTSDDVAIEFAMEGKLSDATKLARKECEKVGKTAEFDVVDKTATPKTRVAKFKCVSATSPAPATE